MSNRPSHHLPSWRSISRPSWMYPFKGMYYFSTHRFLWPLLRARLLPCFLLSLFVYVNLFIWTYIPQVLFLALFHWNGLAWFNGAILVLGEGAAIVALLFEAFFVDETQVDIFDAVLIHEGLEELVAKRRVVLPPPAGSDTEQAKPNPVNRLGEHMEKGAIYAPFSLRQIIEFVVFLPLNFIPWVGVPVFLVLTGYRAGPFQHYRYYALLGVDRKEKKMLIKRRQLRYTWFGTIALMLQLVPGLSMLFLLTTTAGSALWVRDLEFGAGVVENRDHGVVSAGGDDAVERERYTDEPV